MAMRYAQDMPRAVFFDLDDTLLDTSGGVDEAWSLTCQAFASELSAPWEPLRLAIRREAQAFWADEAAVGHWRLDLLGARVLVVRTALTAEGLDDSYSERIAERYREEVTPRMKLFPDTLETLEELKRQGFKLGLITNGPAEMQREKLARFPIEPYFGSVVIEGVFGAGKPDRAVFEHSLRVAGVAPAEAWHVGDNLYADIGGAQAVGIHAVWIHRDRLELKDEPLAVPDRVIGHLAELREGLVDDERGTMDAKQPNTGDVG